MLLVESSFCWLLFLCTRLIKRALIWNFFKFFVFLIAFCLFLEAPSFFCGPPSPSHDFITLLFNFLACFSSQHWALKQFFGHPFMVLYFFVKLRMCWDTRILTWAFFVPFYPADLGILTSFGKGWPHSKFQSDAIHISWIRTLKQHM